MRNREKNYRPAGAEYERVYNKKFRALVCLRNKSQPANQAFGAMTLMASAVAAHDAGKTVTVVIPELERWDMYEALSYVKGESLSGLSTIVSCSDLRKLSALAGTDKRSVLAGLVESSDKLLWLYSTDIVSEELFETGSSVKARSYRLKRTWVSSSRHTKRAAKNLSTMYCPNRSRISVGVYVLPCRTIRRHRG